MATSTGTQLADFEFIEWQGLYDVEKPYEIFIKYPEKEFGSGSRTNLVFKKHIDIPVQDLRGRESELALDENGFQIFNLPTSFNDWSDREAVEREYMRESAEMLRRTLDDVDFVYYYNWRASTNASLFSFLTLSNLSFAIAGLGTLKNGGRSISTIQLTR